jgi:hypothetical protein
MCSPVLRHLGGALPRQGSRGSSHWRRRPKTGRTGHSVSFSTRNFLVLLVHSHRLYCSAHSYRKFFPHCIHVYPNRQVYNG